MDLDLNTEQQVILDAMVDGIRGVDAAGIITLCNDALLRMTGYTRAEVLGHNAHELLHHSRADGSRIPNEQCDLLRASVRGGSNRWPGRSALEKGRHLHGRRILRTRSEERSQSTCYMAKMRDTSEIRIAREALHESEERYRWILESMPDVAWTSDVNGVTRYVSPKVKALLGFTNKRSTPGERICG